MKLYKDSSGMLYSFNDDVNVTTKTCNAGPLPGLPDDLTPYTPSFTDLLSQAQTSQISKLSNACQSAIVGGVPVTVSSGYLVVANTPTDQNNSFMSFMTAQGVMAKAKVWSSGLQVNLNDFCLIGSTYCICQQAGKVGSSQPTPPTDFTSTVKDGSVVWVQFGMLVGIVPSGTVWLSVQDTLSAFSQGVQFVKTQRETYRQLKQDVMSATTISEVQAISWPS